MLFKGVGLPEDRGLAVLMHLPGNNWQGQLQQIYRYRQFSFFNGIAQCATSKRILYRNVWNLYRVFSRVGWEKNPINIST